MPTNTDLIRNELNRIFQRYHSMGQSSVKVVSGELHKEIAFNPGTHPHQMPSVCNVMHEFLTNKDQVVRETPSGRSSTLTIEYKLPR